jgi:drug/metabolite transporter (DMT)-like permease
LFFTRIRSVRSFFAGQPAGVNGILLMLIATVADGCLLSAVRYLSAELHPFELAFFRNLFGLLTITPWFIVHGLRTLRTRHRGLHLVRAGTNVGAMLLYFSGLCLIPLAHAQALGFTAPLFATLLAIVILREKVKLRRWSALIIGFIGALIIIRPGVQEVDSGSLFILMSAALWGFTMVVIKQLSKTDSAVTITAYMGLLMTPLALIPALFVWSWPSLTQLTIIAAGAIAGTLGQMAMAQAFRIAEVTVVMPLDFTKLIWGTLFGYLLFGELIDGWTWLGAVVIFSSVVYIALRERKVKQQQRKHEHARDIR